MSTLSSLFLVENVRTADSAAPCWCRPWGRGVREVQETTHALVSQRGPQAVYFVRVVDLSLS